MNNTRAKATVTIFLPLALACGTTIAAIAYTRGPEPQIDIKGWMPRLPETATQITDFISDNYADVIIALEEAHAEVTL